MVLFINACVRKESRTRRLADVLLARLEGSVEEVRLADICFPVADEEFLRERDAKIWAGNFEAPMFPLARQFANAKTIVIAAPYWDLSFPAALKQYLEQVNVVGLTFRYSEEGFPVGLCRARQLFYVTTAGGSYVPEEFGFGYVRALAQGFYGIPDVRKFEANGLDLVGADAEKLLQEALEQIAAADLSNEELMRTEQ